MTHAHAASDTPIRIPDGVAIPSGDTLLSMVAQARAVSFDFFDTLFIRPLLDPEDAFDLVGARFNIRNYREIRRKAQARAFQTMAAEGRKEIALAGIYDAMPVQHGVDHAALQQAEYDIELALAFPNPDMVWLYEQLVASGRDVVITSDMYLPADFFEAALKKHSLPIVPVFASCDENATKRDQGDLFRLVAQRLEIPGAEILHIGDNPVGDITRAREAGFKAFHYQAPERRKPSHAPCLVSSLSYGMLRTHAADIPPYSFRELGYVYGGPATVGFLEWVRQQCLNDGIDHLLFISRDGYAMERVAQIRSQGSLPPHSYFLGSRTAFSLAAMTDENFREHMAFLLSGSTGLAPAELLERIGVTPPSERVMSELGLGPEVRISEAHHDALKRFLLASQWEVLKVGQRNRHALYRSLLAHGIKAGSRVALVDVGWNGTSQEAFQLAVRDMMDLSVHGYYLCLADTPERLARDSRQNMKAMIDLAQTKGKMQKLYDHRVIVEQFFSAPHDSVIGLDVVRGEVVPITDPGRGKISGLNDTALETVTGIEAFASDFESLHAQTGVTLDPYAMIGPLADLALGEGGDFRQLLERITNFDAWGSSRHRHVVLDKDMAVRN